MHEIVSVIQKIVQRHWLAIPFFLLFFFLLLRNPFSERTLIPNLEPYPDSFHYIDGAMSFLSGYGFVIEREGRTIDPSVPPLYSLVLSPVFIFIPDVRAFYFTNVGLAFLSLWIFYELVRRLFSHRVVQAFILFLYVTSFPVYWFPTLAMAENLLLPIFLTAVLLLTIRVTPKRALLAGAIAVTFYATKYASLPLSLSFPVLYAIKLSILSMQRKGKRNETLWAKIQKEKQVWVSFFLSLAVFGGAFLLYEKIAEGQTIVERLFNVFVYVFFPQPSIESATTEQIGQPTVTRDVFFSTKFMAENTAYYTKWLLGEPITVLWKQLTILPRFLAILSCIGLVVTATRRSTQFVALSLLTMLCSVMVFMSVFYVYDGRYFFIAIPSLFLGAGFFFSLLFDLFPKRQKLLSLLTLIVFGVIFILTAAQLKFAILLNLKYAETPWYYISVRALDQYIREHNNVFPKTPVVISSLPPYLIDAYAKEEMIILPLHKEQEFRSHPEAAWGDVDVTNLIGEYRKFLSQGHPVLLMEYGLGNEGYLHQAFDAVVSQFSTHKVFSGCHDLCDIYELTATASSAKEDVRP